MKRETNEEIHSSHVLRIKIPIIPARIILIGGGSASGKTTIARSMCDKFIYRGLSAKYISMDKFYRSLNEDECGDTFNWDAIEAFDIDTLISCIDMWQRGLACWIPDHNFTEYKSIKNAEFIIPSQVLIIEGIHALSVSELVDTADLRLFITCDNDEALVRRIARDVKDRFYDIDTILTRYLTYVKPALHSVIIPSQKNADYIIANPNNGEVSRENTLELIVDDLVARIQKNII